MKPSHRRQSRTKKRKFGREKWKIINVTILTLSFIHIAKRLKLLWCSREMRYVRLGMLSRSQRNSGQVYIRFIYIRAQWNAIVRDNNRLRSLSMIDFFRHPIRELSSFETTMAIVARTANFSVTVKNLWIFLALIGWLLKYVLRMVCERVYIVVVRM